MRARVSFIPQRLWQKAPSFPPVVRSVRSARLAPNVVLGEDCELVSHVVLDGHTTFGRGNRVFSFACLGIAPQDLKYKGEATRLEIGDETASAST